VFRSLLFVAAMGVIGAMSLLHAEAAHARVTVQMHPESIVKTPFFRLDEIADVTADDAVIADEVRALRIGRSPRAGTVLHISAADVERVLLALKPVLRKELRILPVGDAVIHRGPLQTLQFMRLQEAARTALTAFLAERYSHFQIHVQQGEDAPIVVPEGQLEIRPRTSARTPVPRKITVWTDIYVDGRQYQSVPIKFDVEAYLQVLVALSGAKAEAKALDARLVVKEEQVAGYVEQPVPADINLSALRLKNALATGEVLTWRHVERLPVVSKNQEIRVRLAVGAIEVETVGIALQDAKPGDVIRVRSPENQQTYPAKVSGSGILQALWR
jgi:flagella basal body P-ring formation protein FlgA